MIITCCSKCIRTVVTNYGSRAKCGPQSFINQPIEVANLSENTDFCHFECRTNLKNNIVAQFQNRDPSKLSTNLHVNFNIVLKTFEEIKRLSIYLKIILTWIEKLL